MKFSFANIARLLIIIIVPVLVSATVYHFIDNQFLQPRDANSDEIKLIEIRPGMTFRQICELLEKEQIIRSARALDLLARLKNVQTRIRAGEYKLTPSLTPKQILDAFVNGVVFKRSVTVIPGSTIWDLGEVVSRAGLVSKEKMEEALVDPVLLAKAGINAESFEGYLYPETYQFSRPIRPSEIIWRMLREGEEHWPVEYTDRADTLGMSRHEVLTLASVIEKESGNLEEQPLISAVFHNRLEQGMRLQADPTVIYGIPDFDGNLTREHLETPSPYNTYVNFGLPPGPIANPGESAIRAALFPADAPFLFFVADGTGGHVFSTTLKEHNRAVNKYQKQRKRK